MCCGRKERQGPVAGGMRGEEGEGNEGRSKGVIGDLAELNPLRKGGRRIAAIGATIEDTGWLRTSQKRLLWQTDRPDY